MQTRNKKNNTMNITLSLLIIDKLRVSANFLNNHLSWSIKDSLIQKKTMTKPSLFA